MGAVIFYLKWHVLVHSERYFLLVSSPKNVEFSAGRGALVDIEDVLLGSSEYSVRVMRLISFLLHCNASNLVLGIFKHGKIWGHFALASPLQILGDLSPVIYAHARGVLCRQQLYLAITVVHHTACYLPPCQALTGFDACDRADSEKYDVSGRLSDPASSAIRRILPLSVFSRPSPQPMRPASPSRHGRRSPFIGRKLFAGR